VPEYWNPTGVGSLAISMLATRNPGASSQIIYGGTDQLTALFAESGQEQVPGGLLPIAVCHLGRTRIDSFTATLL